MRSLFVLVFSCLLILGAPAKSQEIILTYRPFSANDTRYIYPENLLKEVLKRTEKKYGESRLARAEEVFSRKRAKQILMTGKYLHVIAEAPKPGWEEDLLPIRIPIRKGIQGYRLFLIHANSQEALSRVNTLEELKKYSTGSGSQWSTRRVMEEAGFEVETGSNYEGLFKMLMHKRFDTFGRGINEVFAEFDTHKAKNLNLAIEKYLALYIPLPTYFFVSPKKTVLAKRIEEGLLSMIDDGSFDVFFLRYHQAYLDAAMLKDRRIFEIPNPNLSKETPLGIEKFWFRP